MPVLASGLLSRPLTLQPSREAAAMDTGRRPTGHGQFLGAETQLQGEAFAGELYLLPSLKLTRASLDELLSEAETVRRQLSGEQGAQRCKYSKT